MSPQPDAQSDFTAEPRDPAADWMPPIEESPQPLEEQVPPAVLATPSHMPQFPEGEVTWWRPSWRDAWRYVGWRWIFLVPALGLVVLALPVVLRPTIFSPFVILGGKLFVFMAAVALTLAGFVVRRAVRARKEPFCIYCGYNLSGLPDRYRCPECGRPYEWRLIAEYRRDPQWFIERWKASQRLPTAAAPFEAGLVRRKAKDGTE